MAIIQDANAFLGTGWSFPPQFSAQGRDLATVSGPDNVHKSVWIILHTDLGERSMRPDFGAGLNKLHFEPIRSRLVNSLKRIVKNALLLHEPRITLDALGVSDSKQAEGVLLIQLQYTVKATNSRFNMVYPYYLNEGM